MKPSTHLINHIGVNVTDAEAATRWYADVLGFEIVIPPFTIVADEGEPGERFARLAGPGFGSCKIAYLTSMSGMMLEIFQFLEPATPALEDPWSYWRPGVWHLGVTCPDLDVTIERVVRTGGRRQSEVVEAPPGSGYRLVFCLDPWGNPLELMNVNCERMITRALPAPTPPTGAA